MICPASRASPPPSLLRLKDGAPHPGQRGDGPAPRRPRGFVVMSSLWLPAPHGRRLRLLNASLLLGADEGPSRAIPCRRRRWSDTTRDRGVGWHSPPLSSSSASSHQRISIPIPRLRGHLPRDRSEPFSKSQRPPRARLYFLFFFS